MNDLISIRVTAGWTTFVMKANLETVKQLVEAQITGSRFFNGKNVEFLEKESPEVEVIKDSDYPFLLRSEVEEKIAQLAEEAAQDLENKDDESVLVEYNETN